MTDNKTITNASVPQVPVNVAAPQSTQVKPPEPVPVSITAQDLTAPDFLHFRPANPAHSLRWVNRIAGNGTRYETMRAAGGRNAKVEDIHKDTPVPTTYLKDGAIINHDIILVVFDRAAYEGRLKQNEQRALSRLNPTQTALNSGSKELSQALNEVEGSATNKAKIGLFPASR
jgi:hypothetical protein